MSYNCIKTLVAVNVPSTMHIAKSNLAKSVSILNLILRRFKIHESNTVCSMNGKQR